MKNKQLQNHPAGTRSYVKGPVPAALTQHHAQIAGPSTSTAQSVALRPSSAPAPSGAFYPKYPGKFRSNVLDLPAPAAYHRKARAKSQKAKQNKARARQSQEARTQWFSTFFLLLQLGQRAFAAAEPVSEARNRNKTHGLQTRPATAGIPTPAQHQALAVQNETRALTKVEGKIPQCPAPQPPLSVGNAVALHHTIKPAAVNQTRALTEAEGKLVSNLDPLPPLSSGNEIDRQCGINRLDVLDQAKRFKSIGIDPHYRCEQHGGPFPTKVKYLTDEELATYRMVIKDGKFYDSTGENLVTAFPRSWRKPIFIMDRNGAFYLSEDAPVGHFHHSSFKGGKNVAGAGEMIIKDGVLQKITRFSGHYKPSDDILRQAVCELRRRGVEVPESIIASDMPNWDAHKSCSVIVEEALDSNVELIFPPEPECSFLGRVADKWNQLVEGFSNLLG